MIRRAFLSALSATSILAASAAAQRGDAAMNGFVPEVAFEPGVMRFLGPVDLDGDGRMDLIGSVPLKGRIWRQVEGGLLTPIFPGQTAIAGRTFGADLDGDGSLSLLHLGGVLAESKFAAPFVLMLPPVILVPDAHLNDMGMAALADLDGDGHQDLLASGFDVGAGLLSFLGDGAGGLQPALTAFSGTSLPSQLGDIDLDGTLDMLAGSNTAVTPLLGNGDGTFHALAVMPIAALPWSIALGHADADGLLDAAIASQTGTQIELGTGSGGFAPGINIPGAARSVHFGDSDRDGRDDDLVITQTGLVTVHTLEDAQLVGTAGVRVSPVSVSDAVFIDLGGTVCVAALNSDTMTSDVTIARCGPDGLPTLEQTFPETAEAYPLAMADVDGDGRKDLVAWQQQAGQVVVHQVPGNGTIGAASVGTPLPVVGSDKPTALVAKLDADAFEDLIVNGPTPWHSNGDGTFTPGNTVNGITGNLAFGDLDGDGDADLLEIDALATWRAMEANGSFGAAVPAMIPAAPNADQQLVLADVNGDGLADLFAGASAGDILAWMALGGGSFAPPQLLDTVALKDPMKFLVQDLDGDGTLDLAASSIVFIKTGMLSVLHGHGDGSFAPAQLFQGSYDLSGNPPQAIDFDHDGRSDLLVTEAHPPRHLLLPQAADGSFGAPRPLPFLMPWSTLFAADVDGDGVEDLLSASTKNISSGEQPLRVGHVHVQAGALDLGHGQVGAVGVPVLTGGGTLRPTELAFVKLQAAPASVPLLLMLGLDTAYAPFKGSTLVPDPQLVLGGLVSDAQGALELQARWPANAPPGLTVYVQVWTTDPIWSWPLSSNALQFQGD